MKPIGIYIHIPFCTRRCGYCDFLTFAGQERNYLPYANALIKEINAYQALHEYTITSIFVGGGTPTTLSPQSITEIFKALGQYKIHPEAEITVEANPGTLSLTMLRALKNSGVNRLSMGLQAWQPRVLKKIDRGHTNQQFLQNYKHARQLGFKNINVDLIFSLPYMESEAKAFDDWYETLQKVSALKPEHISLYSLIIEEGTRFHYEEQQGTLIPQSTEMDRRMYHFAQTYLQKKGYTQYEISNFAQRDKACRHNLLYWQRGEYVGFGIGSSGFINNERVSNIRGLNQYIQLLSAEAYTPKQIIEEVTPIAPQEAMEEFMYLGLRCLAGVSKEKFQTLFNIPMKQVFPVPLATHLQGGLLEEIGDTIRLTKQGLDISNRVFADFIS